MKRNKRDFNSSNISDSKKYYVIPLEICGVRSINQSPIRPVGNAIKFYLQMQFGLFATFLLDRAI